MNYEEFVKEIEISKQHLLSINDGVLQYTDTTYPLRNISHVKLVEKNLEENKNGLFTLLLILIGKGLVFIGGVWHFLVHV